MVARRTKKPSNQALRIREVLMTHLGTMIRSKNLTQTEAAHWLGISQPRVSDLQRRRVDKFNIESLIRILGTAGVRVSVELTDVKRTANHE